MEVNNGSWYISAIHETNRTTGDTFNIDLDHKVMTHPTVGPLFGSYKLQLDLFECPIRLYNAMLHNNALKIGLDMSKVKFQKVK